MDVEMNLNELPLSTNSRKKDDLDNLVGLQTLKITLIKNLEEWVRLIDMSITLFQYQKMIRPLETIDISQYIDTVSQQTCVRLDALHLRLKRRSKNKIPTHSIIFLLCDILIYKESFILFDRKISDRIVNIIKDLIHSPSFDGESIENLRKVVLSTFNTKFAPEKIFSKWCKSKYNLTLARFETKDYSQSKNNISCQIYFDTIRLSVLKNIENNLQFIPSVIELGNFNSRSFNDFLNRYQISCAGPYRTQFSPNSFSNCGIIYFVKSSSKIDQVFNCNNSLSGIFQFSKKSILLRSDFAESYISKLPMIPDWVQKLSP
jgi:hypothetical protein